MFLWLLSCSGPVEADHPLCLSDSSPALDNYYTNLHSSSSAVKPEPVDDEDAFNPNGKRERQLSSPQPPAGVNPFSRQQPTYDSPASTSGSDPKRARLSPSPDAGGAETPSGDRVMVSGEWPWPRAISGTVELVTSLTQFYRHSCFAVAGTQMTFDDVTEEDHERMTPDEYTVRPSQPASLSAAPLRTTPALLRRTPQIHALIHICRDLECRHVY